MCFAVFMNICMECPLIATICRHVLSHSIGLASALLSFWLVMYKLQSWIYCVYVHFQKLDTAWWLTVIQSNFLMASHSTNHHPTKRWQAIYSHLIRTIFMSYLTNKDIVTVNVKILWRDMRKVLYVVTKTTDNSMAQAPLLEWNYPT